MKTFLAVQKALLPLVIYFVVSAWGSPLAGGVLALACALLPSFAVRGLAVPPVFECALIAGLGIADLVGVPDAAHGLLLLCLAAGAAISVVIGRPWTAEFSAVEYEGTASTPLFAQVNAWISGLWAGLYAWLGIAAFTTMPALLHWAPVAVGVFVSVFLPKVLMARGPKRMAAGDARNDWPAPAFARQDAGERTCDVAVVGAGIGGLTAAALLADAGLRVAVFEQHVVPGGFAHTWRRRVRDPETGAKLTFRFDSGVHDVSGWWKGGPVRRVFERLGIADRRSWTRLDHRFELNGRSLTVPRDWQDFAEALAREFPGEAEGLRTLFGEVRAIFDAMYSHGAERGGIPGRPDTAEGMMAFARDHPLAVEWMDRPWTDFVARRIADEEAHAWVSGLFGYVTDDPRDLIVARMVPLYGYWFHGGYYPEGGTGGIADDLVAAIEARGGTVSLRTAVERIVVEDGAATGLTVTDHRGKRGAVTAKAVVCNGDPGAMLDTLIDDGTVAGTVARTAREQVGGFVPSCSAFAVHLGIRDAVDLPPIVHIATDDGGAELVIPSKIDPACAPDGYATLEILSLVSHEEARTWFGDASTPEDLTALRKSAAYRDRKRAIGDALIDRVRTVIPDIDARIVYRSEAGPVTYNRYDRTPAGSIYGVVTGNGAFPAKTPVRNLVVAGAATHGPGIEAVVISGAYAADALMPGILTDARS